MQNINLNICYYDLESTGLCTWTSKILQIAGVCNKDNETFDSYVMTPPNVQITNSFIHHITKETLIENNAPPIDTVLRRFMDWIHSIYGDEILDSNIEKRFEKVNVFLDESYIIDNNMNFQFPKIECLLYQNDVRPLSKK